MTTPTYKSGLLAGCRCWLVLLLLLSLAGCIKVPRPTSPVAARHYLPPSGEQLLQRLAPEFWVEKYQVDYNRPGAVRAASPSTVFIDPDTPVIYAERRQFSTPKGNYTNLLYRVQFKEIPGGNAPFYLGAGKNVGLFIILTLNAKGVPLLLTTVHTCGCYLAFIPTSYLPQADRPKGWGGGERQIVYGENLPAELDYVGDSATQRRVQIRLRPGTHRVMDVWLAPAAVPAQSTLSIALRPLADLQQLPLGDGRTTSFYIESGSRAGHVKGSDKLRERLLMSWWTLAWDIGQDKYLGRDKTDGPVFFTSLKPWARNASDMRDFAAFLHYWGWGL